MKQLRKLVFLYIFSFSLYSQISQILNIHSNHLTRLISCNHGENGRIGKKSAWQIFQRLICHRWHFARNTTYHFCVRCKCDKHMLSWFCKMNYSNVFAMAQQARSLLGAAVAALEGACTFFDLWNFSKWFSTIFRHSSLFLFSFSLDELDLSSFFTTRNKDWDGYCLMKREKKTHSTR